MSNTFTRATTANEHGEVQHENPYGVNEGKAVGPQARSYDHQVVGVDAHGNLKVSGATRSSGTIASGHSEIEKVTDPVYGTSKPLGEASMSDVVFIKGLGSMEIKSAIAAGFLPRNVLDGGVAAPQVQQQAPQVQQQAPDVDPDVDQGEPEGGEVLADEAAVAELASTVDPGLQQALIEQAASDTLEASALVEAGGEKALGVRDAFVAQGRDAFAAATGLDGDALQGLIDGIKDDAPEAWSQAVRDHLTQRSTAGYTRLAEQALNSLTAENLGDLPEGVTVSDQGGTLTLTINGQTFTLAEALRSGVVTLA